MNVLRNIVLMSSLFMLSGCLYATGPNNNLRFNDTATLKSFEGVYRNVGEADPKSIPVNCPNCRRRLSPIIWPEDKNLDHTTIDAIEVRRYDGDALIVTALNKGMMVKESKLVEGSDFTLKSGRIHIKTEIFLAAPVIGPGYQTLEIGLDSEGNGKFREYSGAVGFAFFLIPVGAAGTDDVRFERIQRYK